MKSNEPIRQHLVPRCYLRNFSLAKKKDWYIDVYDKTSQNPEMFNTNIKNVCVERDFYTFSKLKDEDKRFMERYFSNTVESDYSEIYDTLVKKKITKISNNVRFKIISYVVSQFFRTSKLTHEFNLGWNKLLEQLWEMSKNIEDKKVHLDGGGTIDFNGKTLEEIKKEQSSDNREMINIKKYQLFKKWTIEKLDSILLVNECASNFGYIIGDNPVIANGHFFDPSVHIQLPLDHKHCLVLIPRKKMQEADLAHVTYNKMGHDSTKVQTEFSNICQFEKAQRVVMGKSKLIMETLKIMENFNATDFNVRAKSIIEKVENQGVF